MRNISVLDYIFKPIRAAAILTTGYVAGTVIENAQGYNQMNVDAVFTIGSLTDAQIKIEFSNDGTTYIQETFSSISSGEDTLSTGVHVLGATGNFEISLPIMAKYIKISAIGTGTVTGSSLAINARLGTR